jgi:hypothetical protein
MNSVAPREASASDNGDPSSGAASFGGTVTSIFGSGEPLSYVKLSMESLILAQDERWRRA